MYGFGDDFTKGISYLWRLYNYYDSVTIAEM
jgi:hypothetical protein